MRGNDRVRVERRASAEPTLDELAQKLWDLRQHLEHVLIPLNRTGSDRLTEDSRADESRLRCYACNRTGSTRHAGWTLRLCGDDELHPFCPECDRRDVDGEGSNVTRANPFLREVHLRPAVGDVTG